MDNSQNKKCKRCKGKGYTCEIVFVSYNMKDEKGICKFCNGTGLWKDTHYIHVFEKDGKKIAIDSDHFGS